MTRSYPPTPLNERPRSGPYSGLTFRSVKRFLAKQFEAEDLPFADEDALDLVLGMSGLSQAEYIARGTDFISAELFDQLNQAAQRRLGGEPVDRILGWRDFYGRRFQIDYVLSPRGDTETLLIAALTALRTVTNPNILDLGTGSGALALTLLCEQADAQVTATDIDPKALETAQRNAERLEVGDRVSWHLSNWFDALPAQRFDLIISNPPYISTKAMTELDREVAEHDPERALHGGEDGLAPYRVIIPAAPDWLKPGGWLGVEIGFDQADAVTRLFQQAGFTDIQGLQDPAGLDRVVCGRLP